MPAETLLPRKWLPLPANKKLTVNLFFLFHCAHANIHISFSKLSYLNLWVLSILFSLPCSAGEWWSGLVGNWHPAKVNPSHMGTALINQRSSDSEHKAIKTIFPMMEGIFSLIYHLECITTETMFSCIQRVTVWQQPFFSYKLRHYVYLKVHNWHFKQINKMVKEV